MGHTGESGMSLRARILSLVLGAALLPVLALIGLLLEHRQTEVAAARQRLGAMAQGLAAELENRTSGTAQLLFGLGHVPVLKKGDRQACSDFLADVLKEHPQYTGLLTILPDGQLHCDSLRSGRRLDLNDRRYFVRARSSTRHVIEPVVGRIGPDTGGDLLKLREILVDLPRINRNIGPKWVLCATKRGVGDAIELGAGSQRGLRHFDRGTEPVPGRDDRSRRKREEHGRNAHRPAPPSNLGRLSWRRGAAKRHSSARSSTVGHQYRAQVRS